MERHLLDHRVLFVTGKGGVGKTTVSCALALCAAKRGKRVLLVETGPKENMSFIFGTRKIGYEPLEVYPGIEALYLQPYEALTEFLTSQLKIKLLARTVVNNRIFRYLTEVAPGWRELITLGKIWMLADHKPGQPVFDTIIVDAPATGHGLSLLRLPQVLLDTLAFGPIKHYTGKVQEMLADPKKTSLNVVTLAEEMPVSETIDLVTAAHQTLSAPLGVVFANAIYPEVFSRGQKKQGKEFFKNEKAVQRLGKTLGADSSADDVRRCAKSLAKRRALHEKYIALLKKNVDLPLVQLPFMFTEYFDVRDLEDLAVSIENALEVIQ